MSGFSNGPVRSRILDEFAQIRAEHRAKMSRIDEESRERYSKVLERSAQKDKEIEAWQGRRKAEKAEAAKAEGEKGDDKPENPWAQPTRLPDSAARIGRFDDEDVAPPAESAASAEPPAPRPTPVPSPPPAAAAPEPPAASPRHSRLDDDDDFEAGSFLRG